MPRSGRGRNRQALTLLYQLSQPAVSYWAKKGEGVSLFGHMFRGLIALFYYFMSVPYIPLYPPGTLYALGFNFQLGNGANLNFGAASFSSSLSILGVTSRFCNSEYPPDVIYNPFSSLNV